MLEVLVVQARQPLTIAYRLTDDDHGGELEPLLADDPCEIPELPAVDPLLGVGQLIADRHRGGRRVVGEQLPLYLLSNRGTEVDAHRAL